MEQEPAKKLRRRPKLKSKRKPLKIDMFKDLEEAKKVLSKDLPPDMRWWLLKALSEEKQPSLDDIFDALRSSSPFAEMTQKTVEEVVAETETEARVSFEHLSDAESIVSDKDTYDNIAEIEKIMKKTYKESLLEEHYATRDLKGYEDDLFVLPPTPPPTPPADILEDRRSVFQKMFLMKKNEVASSWRKPVKKTSYSEMTLEEQGEHETAEIAKEFCEWLQVIGMQNLRIDENIVKELFEINMQYPAVHSFCVEIKELSVVPKSIAELYNVKNKSERAVLHQLLRWDCDYEKKNAEEVAFGKCHPQKHKKWNKNTNDVWFWPRFVSKELESGGALWDELLGTEVLDYYCIWLIENPQQKVPEYLEKIGYIAKVKANYKGAKGELDLIKKKRNEQHEFWLFSKPQYDEEEETYRNNLPKLEEVQFLLKDYRSRVCEECEQMKLLPPPALEQTDKTNEKEDLDEDGEINDQIFGESPTENEDSNNEINKEICNENNENDYKDADNEISVTP